MNRKKLLLSVLVLLFVGAVVSAIVRSPKQERVTQLKYRPGVPAPVRRPSGSVASPGRVVSPGSVASPGRAPQGRAVQGRAPGRSDEGGLNVALLEREQPRFSGYRSNIFKPIFREEVKLPPVRSIPLPPKPALPLPPPPRQPVAVPPAPPPPPPIDPVAAELARFTFLGFMSKDGNKTVFLSKDKEIYVVKKGSTVAGKFAVTDLTDDALTLSSLTGGKELVIPLVENRALIPQRSGRRTP